jgi:hypothetical protein
MIHTIPVIHKERPTERTREILLEYIARNTVVIGQEPNGTPIREYRGDWNLVYIHDRLYGASRHIEHKMD